MCSTIPHYFLDIHDVMYFMCRGPRFESFLMTLNYSTIISGHSSFWGKFKLWVFFADVVPMPRLNMLWEWRVSFHLARANFGG